MNHATNYRCPRADHDGARTRGATRRLVVRVPCPSHPRLLSQYWPAFTAYGALALVSLVVALYATARAAGLADLGRKVDLVERSIRRGAGGDPELAEQMQQQDRGDFDD